MRTLELALSEQAKKALATYKANTKKARAVVVRSLQKVTALFLREAQKAFERKGQPGTDTIWAPNYGRDPGQYGWVKTNIFGLDMESQGTFSGETKRSLIQEIDTVNLVSRVGSPLEKARKLAEGGRYGPFTIERGGETWFFGGGRTPPRPFLPEPKWARGKATAMLRSDLAQFAKRMNEGRKVSGTGVSA